MNVKDVRDRILEGVFLNVSQCGFKINKRDKHFERSYNGFHQIFDLLFQKSKDGIYIEPVLQIKSKEIEDIYHKVSKKEPKYHSGTVTLGNNLLNIIDYYENGKEVDSDPKQRYVLEEDQGIPILIKVISNNFEKYGLSYFNQNSSIERVDELLNRSPHEISIHNWLYPMRACIAIIAAKLNNNPQFEELLNIYEQGLGDAVEPYKTDFEALKGIVMRIRFNEK